MSKYEVRVRLAFEVDHTCIVEAEDEEEAKDAAYDIVIEKFWTIADLDETMDDFTVKELGEEAPDG